MLLNIRTGPLARSRLLKASCLPPPPMAVRSFCPARAWRPPPRGTSAPSQPQTTVPRSAPAPATAAGAPGGSSKTIPPSSSSNNRGDGEEEEEADPAAASSGAWGRSLAVGRASLTSTRKTSTTRRRSQSATSTGSRLKEHLSEGAFKNVRYFYGCKAYNSKFSMYKLCTQ